MPFCLSLNTATLTYWSLEYGLLSGKIPKDQILHRVTSGTKQSIGIHGTNHIIAKNSCLCSLAGMILTKNTTALFLNSSLLGQQHTTVSHVLCGSKTVDQSIENATAGNLNIASADIKRMEDDLSH